MWNIIFLKFYKRKQYFTFTHLIDKSSGSHIEKHRPSRMLTKLEVVLIFGLKIELIMYINTC